MTISVSDVVLIAPEYTAEDPARITSFIAIATKFINRKTWGDKADIATAYFTAHLLKSTPILVPGGSTGTGTTGPSGPTSSEKVGDIQASYSDGGGGSTSTSTSTSGIGTTYYGQIFEQLKRSLLISPIING
jgi:hypothetical protein